MTEAQLEIVLQAQNRSDPAFRELEGNLRKSREGMRGMNREARETARATGEANNEIRQINVSLISLGSILMMTVGLALRFASTFMKAITTALKTAGRAVLNFGKAILPIAGAALAAFGRTVLGLARVAFGTLARAVVSATAIIAGLNPVVLLVVAGIALLVYTVYRLATVLLGILGKAIRTVVKLFGELLKAAYEVLKEIAILVGQLARQIGQLLGEALKRAIALFGALGKVALGVVAAVTYMGARFGIFASKIEVSWQALALLSKNLGISFDLVTKKIEILKQQGITTTQALKGMMKWLQVGLPVQNIDRLARAAQDMAAAWGVNSSELFGRFIEAISTSNVILLEEVGIIENLTQIFPAYAASIGKTVDELTALEQRQAIYNHIMGKAATLTGSYERAMGFAGKQMTSLARFFENLKEAIGNIFLPAISAGVVALTNFLVGIKDVVRGSTWLRGAFQWFAYAYEKFLSYIDALRQSRVGQMLQDQFGRALHALGVLVAWVESKFEELLPRLAAFFKKHDLAGMVQAMAGAMIAAFEWIEDNAGPIWDAVVTKTVAAVDWIGHAVYGLMAGIRYIWSSANWANILNKGIDAMKEFGVAMVRVGAKIAGMAAEIVFHFKMLGPAIKLIFVDLLQSAAGFLAAWGALIPGLGVISRGRREAMIQRAEELRGEAFAGAAAVHAGRGGGLEALFKDLENAILGVAVVGTGAVGAGSRWFMGLRDAVTEGMERWSSVGGLIQGFQDELATVIERIGYTQPVIAAAGAGGTQGMPPGAIPAGSIGGVPRYRRQGWGETVINVSGPLINVEGDMGDEAADRVLDRLDSLESRGG